MSNDSDHEVSREALQRFLDATASGPERRRVVRHLLKECALCRSRLGEAPSSVEPYAEVFARAEAAARTEYSRLAAERLLADLEALPAEQRELRVRNSRRFAHPVLAKLLAESSIAAAQKDPDLMWAFAQLSLTAADAAARSGSVKVEEMSDVLACAWGAVGNAHRLRSELPEAGDAFARAFEYLAAGTGSLETHAWLSLHFFSLRLFRREFEEARALASEVVECYRRLRKPAGEAAALIKLGIAWVYAGNPEAALPSLRSSLDLARECGDEPLARLAINNLVRCYVDLGALQEAHAVVQASDLLFEFCEEEIVKLKWKWNAARLERDLGLFPSAIARLEAVREGFLERGLRVEVADVSLDLADVYLRTHDGPGVLRTLGETIPLYQALGATRELLAALLQLTQSVHDHEQAVTLFAAVSPQLRSLLQQGPAPLPA